MDLIQRRFEGFGRRTTRRTELWTAGRREDHVYSGRQLRVSRTRVPSGLRFSGEIDASNAPDVAELLSAFDRQGDLHVDLTTLMFCDVSGIRALVAHAERLDSRGRLLLHGLPAQIEKVLNVVGWAELPGIGFCNCEMG